MSEFEVQVRSHCTPSPAAAGYAREKVAAALSHTGMPVLRATVTLDRLAHPGLPRPAMVRVEVDLNGTMVRAHADGATHAEAVDLMQDRLRARMARLTRR